MDMWKPVLSAWLGQCRFLWLPSLMCQLILCGCSMLHQLSAFAIQLFCPIHCPGTHTQVLGPARNPPIFRASAKAKYPLCLCQASLPSSQGG